MIPILVGVEDLLSEQVARRLLHEAPKPYEVSAIISRGGFGYLRSRIESFNRTATSLPFFLLTDLDTADCPPTLISSWLRQPKNANLILSVAVREVEAWLLGDHEGFANFLSVSTDLLPVSPEDLLDPKQEVVRLARRSRSSSVRTRVAPKIGSTAKQGAEYNQCLTEFVNQKWNIASAADRCPSLARCLKRLTDYECSA